MTDDPSQAAAREAREHINQQKSRDGIETPRTVEEQVATLDTSGEDHRRRDPLEAADAQRRD